MKKQIGNEIIKSKGFAIDKNIDKKCTLFEI